MKFVVDDRRKRWLFASITLWLSLTRIGVLLDEFEVVLCVVMRYVLPGQNTADYDCRQTASQHFTSQ